MHLPPFKMKAIAAVLATGVLLSACGGGGSSSSTSVAAGTAAYVTQYHELKGNFSENVSLTAADGPYKITGEVNFLSGTTLTIEAGTVLYGTTGNSYLAINRGAQIIANGDIGHPIIFTSAADVAAGGSTINQGEWGGLTLIGAAPIVGGEMTYEAGTQVGGGTDPHDSSGSLKYVVVKNTGFAVEIDKELNGLSMLAVGDGTTLQNIAILGSADDGIEYWGGNSNVDGLYVFDAGDDSFDTDMGFTGSITNGYAKQYQVDKTNYDSSGIETGNDSDSYTSTTTSPVIGDTTLANNSQPTMATYTNCTVEAVGGAIYLKNDAGGIFNNVLVTSADPTYPGLTATANQAIVTHRTLDTVEDLSDTTSSATYGIQILSGGLSITNNAYPGEYYRRETSKDFANGGCDTADAQTGADAYKNCTGHVLDYWETNNPSVANLVKGSAGSVTGATIANIWKGNAGDNNATTPEG